MDSHSRYKINSSKIVHDTIEGEVIIINFDTGVYYSLNSVCKDVWSHLEKGAFLPEIVDDLMNKYEGEKDVIQSEVNQLLTELAKEELLISIEDADNNREKQRNILESADGNNKPLFTKPAFRKYTDMKEMLLLDPIHEVDETGWPATKMPPKKKD